MRPRSRGTMITITMGGRQCRPRLAPWRSPPLQWEPLLATPAPTMGQAPLQSPLRRDRHPPLGRILFNTCTRRIILRLTRMEGRKWFGTVTCRRVALIASPATKTLSRFLPGHSSTYSTQGSCRRNPSLGASPALTQRGPLGENGGHIPCKAMSVPTCRTSRLRPA